MRVTTKALAAVAASALLLTACGGADSDDGGAVTITLVANAIAGGKNAAEAEWIESWLIPEFEAAQAEQGRDVTVEFEAQGVDDEDYKTKIALDLQSGGGADVIGMDGIWVGEFAEAGYILPLNQVGGDDVDSWEGWDQIPDAVQSALSFEGERYGIPQGADGRVVYYNRDLFEQAGLPTEWQPTSWQEILDAGQALAQLDGVTPIQLNAGVPMGEATTMQGLLPMLVGAGGEVWSDDMWLGATPELREVLELYRSIYVDDQLGDAVLQQEAAGRDTSFQLFADGQIGMLFEGDYFWRSVINPEEGTAPMADRDETVGYALIPAASPGAGINGQDFVSMSGGTGRVLNPSSEHPEIAWELLAFMNSAEAYEERVAGTVSITPREDVNATVLADDEMLTFVSEEVLPITAYRPGLAAYPEVSILLQEATATVVAGGSVDEALSTYTTSLAAVVGEENINNG